MSISPSIRCFPSPSQGWRRIKSIRRRRVCNICEVCQLSASGISVGHHIVGVWRISRAFEWALLILCDNDFAIDGLLRILANPETCRFRCSDCEADMHRNFPWGNDMNEETVAQKALIDFEGEVLRRASLQGEGRSLGGFIREAIEAVRPAGFLHRAVV